MDPRTILSVFILIVQSHGITIEEKDLAPSYDFIIVGSGSAGATLANRLSEIESWKILLLEAGTPENLWAQIPLTAPTMAATHYNWGYYAEKQENMSAGMVGKRMKWPRGRALGGTSVINFMIYTRGSKYDYDRWERAGNPGWNYEEVLKYFIKAENVHLKDYEEELHGKSGYLSVGDVYQSRLVPLFLQAGEELGLPNFDYNANLIPFGVSPIQATVQHGRRGSVAKCYLKPIKNRKNLHILTSSFVTRLILHPQDDRATGVEFERFGRKHKVEVRKEVILSAGTFLSAQLLMLAGIGPKEHLQELGITVRADLPVGKNLQDHLTYPGLSFVINQNLPLSVGKVINVKSAWDFLFKGTGPLTALGGVEGITYVKTNISEEVEDIPDMEILFIGGSLSTDFGLWNRKWINIDDETYNTVYAPLHTTPTFSMWPMLLHPKSTGYLKLGSTDPHHPPLFYGNYFTDPEGKDLGTFVESIRIIQRFVNSKPFAYLKPKLHSIKIPVCKEFAFDSDEYWKCAVRAIGVTLHHQVGTARMGTVDENSVVDNKLKVHGFKGLRVADCSVIPFAIGAHTNAVSVMIGEKGADIIKQQYGML